MRLKLRARAIARAVIPGSIASFLAQVNFTSDGPRSYQA
jgi:hypothetical protein